METRAFRRACRDGMTPYRYGRIMLTGKYGDGKTSLIQALLGKPIPEDHIPTDGLDSRYSCKVDITKCTEDWSELLIEKTEMLDEHLASAVIRHAERKEHTEDWKPVSKAGPSSDKSQTEAGENPGAEDTHLVKDDDRKLFEKVNERKDAKKPEKHEDKAVIFVWDFGGQDVYTNLHPVFLRTDCVHIVVYDLEKLENVEDKEELKNYADQIELWLQMIQSNRKISRYTKQVKNVLLVGTHKDKLQGNSPEEKEKCAIQLIEKLKVKLAGKHYKNLITEYFHVDSRGGIQEDFENFQNLKECLVKSIKEGPTWEEERPIRYMRLLGKLYEQEAKPECAMMKLDDIKRYAEKYIDAEEDRRNIEEDVKHFLRFHHATGDLTYFPDQKMKDFVIVNAQWLINVFTRVITIDEYYNKMDSVDKEELERLRKEGLIRKSGSLLADLWRDFLHGTSDEKDAQIEHLKQLMCKFDLMMEYKSGDYLIPCLMKKADELEQPKHDSPTIYLQFHASKTSLDCFLPPALFHQLICRLAGSKDVHWIVDSSKSQRNLFKFRVPGQHITVATQSTWIRLSLDKKRHAVEILGTLRSHLRQLMENCYHNMWFEFYINPCQGPFYLDPSAGVLVGTAIFLGTEDCIASTGYGSMGGELRDAVCETHDIHTLEKRVIESKQRLNTTPEYRRLKTSEYNFWFGE